MSMKKTLTIAAMAAVMMLGAVTAPTTAFAAAATAPATEVTIAGPATPDPKPEEQNISVSVPTKLALAMTPEGNLSSSASFNIINNSNFGIHVKDIQVTQQSPFSLVASSAFDGSLTDNVFTFTLSNQKGNSFDAATSFVPGTAAFNLGTSGQADATLALTATGKAKNVKADLATAPASAAKITWTFAPGTAK